MIELLATKLFIPRPRKNLVARPRLVERLNAGLEKKLTLIAAPAGFGKTTLLSEWIPKSPRCVTWFSLDEGDNDQAKFWAYFIKSLQRLRAELGEGAFSLLQSPQALPITTILTALINDLTSFQDPFAVVLDDYHIIDAQPIHDGLTFLIDHLPKNMHLVITTRVDPPLPLARIRAHDDLTELRANDLRFSVKEAAEFLGQAMGLNVSAEAIVALEARTEGWIAGLQIAALSMQGHHDMEGFVRAFSGSHRQILAYLATEVIDKQPGRILNFLLKTSILDRLCGPLCDAVTGEPDGQVILEELEHTNLFVMALDEEGRWYRYHHLFVEVLRARLQRAHPDLMPELYRRASAWYERNGRLSEAVSHALAAKDFMQAARLIELTSGAMWQRGEVTTLQNWLAALPTKIRRASPQLCLAQAWGALAVGQLAVVDSSIVEAEEAMSPFDEANVRPLRAEANAIRSALAGYRQDSAKSIELAQRAIQDLPQGEHFLRGRLTYNLGWASMSQGDLPTASQRLREAATFSLNAGDLSTASFALNALGAGLEAEGRLGESASCYQQVIQAIQKHGQPLPVTAASGAYVRLGGILYEWNDLDKATQCANQGIELSRPFQTGGALFIGYLVLARVLGAQGDLTSALNALQSAETAARSDATLQPGLRMVEAVRAQFWLAQGNIRSVAHWTKAYETGLNFPANGDWPGIRQFSPVFDYECLTLVRVRMAQAQWDQALKLLTGLKPVIESGSRNGSLIKLLSLRALALRARALGSESIAALEHVLTLAEPEGYIRTFVDEGEPMRLLLLDYQSIIKKKIGDKVDNADVRLLTYTDKLLAAFSQPAVSEKPNHKRLPEPLSERELDILRLIATGRSNQEIAEILVIGVSTVKSHINNMYGKLGTNRRTEAITIAHDMGLLQE